LMEMERERSCVVRFMHGTSRSPLSCITYYMK
jgi:hypothetical protein